MNGPYMLAKKLMVFATNFMDFLKEQDCYSVDLELHLFSVFVKSQDCKMLMTFVLRG